MHRYGFSGDGLQADGSSHKPTAVACVNGILGEMDRAMAKEDPDARDHVMEWVGARLTNLACKFDRLYREG